MTRVSLGKSLKPAAADEGAVSGAVTEDDGCGTGRPPAFEVVMFFERSKVPATRAGHHRRARRRLAARRCGRG